MSRSILITGGAGFIGSNFIHYYTKKYPDRKIVNLDKLTYAANLDNLKSLDSSKNYSLVEGDICDSHLLDQVFGDYRIDGVFHFAAESHVDNSIASPEAFIKTNIEGTFQLLNVARKHWLTNKENGVDDKQKKTFFARIDRRSVWKSWE